MSEQKDMILENFLSSAIRTLDTDEIYNILMDSLILLLHPQGLLLTQNLNTGRIRFVTNHRDPKLTYGACE